MTLISLQTTHIYDRNVLRGCDSAIDLLLNTSIVYNVNRNLFRTQKPSNSHFGIAPGGYIHQGNHGIDVECIQTLGHNVPNSPSK